MIHFEVNKTPVMSIFVCSQVTSGGLIFNEMKADHSDKKCARFYRVAPKGGRLSEFKLDGTNMSGMIEVNFSKVMNEHDGLKQEEQ